MPDIVIHPGVQALINASIVVFGMVALFVMTIRLLVAAIFPEE